MTSSGPASTNVTMNGGIDERDFAALAVQFERSGRGSAFWQGNVRGGKATALACRSTMRSKEFAALMDLERLGVRFTELSVSM